MPYLPAKPCRFPGCPGLAAKGPYCDAHRAARTAPDTRESAYRRGYDRRWQRTRAFVLANSPICVACRRAPATEVDHITPLRRGGTHHADNLQALCKSCHSRKTALFDHTDTYPRR